MKIIVYESYPPQGLSEARRDSEGSEFFSLIRSGGVPSGAAALHPK